MFEKEKVEKKEMTQNQWRRRIVLRRAHSSHKLVSIGYRGQSNRPIKPDGLDRLLTLLINYG